VKVGSASIPAGKRLGPYEVLAPIAEGGMGVVYRAYDRALDRTVALKVLASTVLLDTTFAERFHREAQLWARLEHPCIVPVYLAGIEDGRPFIAMRFIEGGSLDNSLREGPLQKEKAFRILADIARALDFAHSQGIVHRDVKPGNVLVDGEGRAYLSDFGIARAIAGDAGIHLTAEVVGTPAYMSPEQARSQNPGPLADLYSLGCLAYELVTGRPPFEGETAIQVLMRHVSEAPVSPKTYVPSVEQHVEDAILKAMAKEPGERWPTGGVFVQALTGQISAEAVHTISLPGRLTLVSPTPRPPGATAAKPRLTRKRVAIAALLLAAVGIAGLLLWQQLYPYDVVFPGLPQATDTSDDRVNGLKTAVSYLLDAGDYAAAEETVRAAIELHPERRELRTLRDRVRSAWEAEKTLGLWVEPTVVSETTTAPSPSPSDKAASPTPAPELTP